MIKKLLVDVIAPFIFGLIGLGGGIFILYNNPNFENQSVILTLLFAAGIFVYGMIASIIGAIRIK